MDKTLLTELVQELQLQASKYQPGDERERQKLLATSTKLMRFIETPSERIARMCYSDPFLYIAVRILVDLDVFRMISSAKKSVTIVELAEKTGADVGLLGRLLKHICTQEFVREVGPDEYLGNELTQKIASPEGQGAVTDMFPLHRIGDRLPDYLKERGYSNPTDKDDTPFQYAYQTTDHYFQYLSRKGRESELKAFHDHMRFKTLGLKWHEMPNVMEAVFGTHRASPDEILMVDVGGGSGHDLINFRAVHPNMTGRLILQELPGAIRAAKAGGDLTRNAVEAMEHDFFTEENIRGARVYYLKMVLHDWPDEQCRQILRNLKPALKSDGHGRILLNEIIIPETDAGWFETSLDMIMMSFLSTQERREKHWRAMVESVGGLRVSNIWDVDGAVEKIIEVVLE